MAEKLNKLQIKAMVLDVINSYKTANDFSSKSHEGNIKTLNGIKDKKFVTEILLKELINSKGITLEAVKILIADFATLDMVESTIWEILKNKDIPDKSKENYLQILRLMGGKIDVQLLMDCMENFDAVVDEQTQELLQIAIVNPEAQIDFFDFLFSISKTEQVQLIKSLENDFKGDELANVLSPCLQIKLDDNIKEIVIGILGSSSSYFAAKPLKKFIQISNNDSLKRLALKALNQLKSAGIDIDNDDAINIKEKEVCNGSKFYKAYLSQVDGCGNQGLIFSRIAPNGNITMFSTVINAFTGIIDCFGMLDITLHDFQKVISRFKANDLVVPITAEVAKFKLSEAENINNITNNILPYEYVCWSIYAADIEENALEYEDLMVEKIDNFTNEVYKDLYDTENFDSWYFEYDDNIEVQKLIDFVVAIGNEPSKTVYEKTEDMIEKIYNSVFTAEKINEYSSMLKNAGYIYYLNNNFNLANVAINLSHAVYNDNRFFKDILRRSILQHLADIVTKEQNIETNYFAKNENKISLEKEVAYKLLNEMENLWDEADV